LITESLLSNAAVASEQLCEQCIVDIDECIEHTFDTLHFVHAHVGKRAAAGAQQRQELMSRYLYKHALFRAHNPKTIV
jgi:predicted molibdopterin-dependent oxidoreductase YjgC